MPAVNMMTGQGPANRTPLVIEFGSDRVLTEHFSPTLTLNLEEVVVPLNMMILIAYDESRP